MPTSTRAQTGEVQMGLHSRDGVALLALCALALLLRVTQQRRWLGADCRIGLRLSHRPLSRLASPLLVGAPLVTCPP